MGPATEEEIVGLRGYEGYQYSDPEFSWEQPVAPTGLAFIDSEPLKKFNGSLFVGDCTAGSLYKFTLNEGRDGFAFASPQLSDNVANRGEPQDEIIFGTGFGCVTDVEMGPDGLLYIVSLSEGAIFRIAPVGMAQDGLPMLYPAVAVAAAAGAVYALRKRRRM